MGFKFDIHPILLTIIALCILYFGYRIYEEKYNKENFENDLRTSLSTYYPDNTLNNANNKDFHFVVDRQGEEPTFNGLNESVGSAVKSYRDADVDYISGTWTNFNDLSGLSGLASDQYYCYIRKMGSFVYFTIIRRDVDENGKITRPADYTGPNYPYGSLVGIAKVSYLPNGFTEFPNSYPIVKILFNELDPSKPVRTEQDVNNARDSTISYNILTKALTIKFSGSNTLGGSFAETTFIKHIDMSSNKNPDNFVYSDSPLIAPSYVSNAPQVEDIVCPTGYSSAKFLPNAATDSDSNTVLACYNENVNKTIVTNKNYYKFSGDLTDDNICFVNSDSSRTSLTAPSTTGTFTMNACSPNFNVILKNGFNTLLNSFQKNDGDKNTILHTCPFLNDLSSKKYAVIMYFYNDKQFTSLSYQVWGGSKDNRVVTKPTKLNSELTETSGKWYNSLSSNTNIPVKDSSNTVSINTNETTNPTIWKITRGFNTSSCYFTIKSVQTGNAPEYYVQGKKDGSTSVSFFEGGFDQYFTLVNPTKLSVDVANGIAYSGQIKSSNKLFLSPGTDSITELNPFSVNSLNQRSCSLVSKPNTTGQWVIYATDAIGDGSKVDQTVIDSIISKISA